MPHVDAATLRTSSLRSLVLQRQGGNRAAAASGHTDDKAVDEAARHIRDRNEVRRRKIDEQCESYKAQFPDRVAEADALHAEHLGKIKEAEEKMVEMFNSADIDGNGQLSWTEYSLAEAHWLSSSINPDKVSLFGQ